MSPTSRSRKRIRRAQLLAGRSTPVDEEAWWLRFSERTPAEELDDWMVAYWPARVAAALFVLACGAVAVFAVFAVRAVDDFHAYENAPTCDSSTPATIDCLREVPAVITGVSTTVTGSGKSRAEHYYVDVSNASQPSSGLELSGLPQTPPSFVMHIELPDTSGVRAIAQYGDFVTVELWHGDPISITDGPVTSGTMDIPRKTMVDSAVGVLVALAAAATFALNWLRLRDASRNGAEHWPRWLVPLGPTMFLATFGSAFAGVLGSQLQSVLATVLADGAIVLLVGAIFTVRWRRAITRST
jgi:hypothetical protein